MEESAGHHRNFRATATTTIFVTTHTPGLVSPFTRGTDKAGRPPQCDHVLMAGFFIRKKALELQPGTRIVTAATGQAHVSIIPGVVVLTEYPCIDMSTYVNTSEFYKKKSR